MDTPTSSVNTANTQLKHPIIWGFYTQEDPDVIHIKDYDGSLIIEMMTLDGEMAAMCGYVAERYDEPRLNQFILGNVKICRKCIDIYAQRGGVQATRWGGSE